MKAIVDKNICISCGACVSTYPEIFSFNENNIAVASNEDISKISDVSEEACKEICPVGAIDIVE